MLAGIALLAALAVPGAPEGLAEEPSVRSPTRISFDGIGNGWTGGRTRWWIEPDGRGGYDSTERGQRVSGRFDAGAQGFQRVQTLLAPLSGLQAMPCQGLATDQPVGSLSWRYGERATSLRVEFGCADSNRLDAWNRFGQAVGLVREWATIGSPAP